MVINKRFTQLNNSGSNHNLLDAYSGKITGSLEVTGSAYFPGGLSGSLTTLTDGSPFIIGTGTVTVTSVSNGAITINGTSTTVPEYFYSATNNVVESSGSLYVSGNLRALSLSASNGAEVTGSFAVSGSGVIFDFNLNSADEVVVRNDNTGDFVKLTTGSISYDNGINPDKFEIYSANDLNVNALGDIFITASIGNMYVGADTVFEAGLSGSLQTLSDGTPYLISGPNITITTNSLGQIEITGSAGATSPQYWFSTGSNEAYTTGSVLIKAGLAASPSQNLVKFDVSGSPYQSANVNVYGAQPGAYIAVEDVPVAASDWDAYSGSITIAAATVLTSGSGGNVGILAGNGGYLSSSVGLNFGGGISLIAGQGGNNEDAGAFSGGGGGQVNISGGTAGNGYSAGGTGGNTSLSAGNGGTKTANNVSDPANGGDGGDLSIYAGGGGDSQIGGTPGVGGDVTINPGSGGKTDTNLDGVAGNIIIKGAYLPTVSASQIGSTLTLGTGDQGFGNYEGFRAVAINDNASDVLAASSDTYFFVSGGLGSKDTTDRGVAVFGGDLHVSGGLTVDAPARFFGGLSGSLQALTDGSPYLIAGPNVTITTNSLGQIEITGSAGSSSPEYWTSDVANAIWTSGSVLARGGDITTAASDYGTDTFFFVSGAIDGIYAGNGVSAFGGDLFVSGNMFVSSSTQLWGNSQIGADNVGASLTVRTDVTTTNILINDSNNATIKIANVSSYDDVSVSSGSIILRQNYSGGGEKPVLTLDANTIAYTVSAGGTADTLGITSAGDITLDAADKIFVTASNGMYVGADTVFAAGLTGSLQEVSAGVPYLLAGDYITIATNSLGQIAISASNIPGSEVYWQSTVSNNIFTTGSIAVTGSAIISSSLTVNPAGTGRGLLRVGGLDIGPITGSAVTTSGVGNDTAVLSGDILSASFGVWDAVNTAVVRHEVHILGIGYENATATFQSFAATYLIMSFIDGSGIQTVKAVTELSREISGSYAANWDVNFGENLAVQITGAIDAGAFDNVNWYGQRVKEMSLNFNQTNGGSRT
jgi:hypothetical protein